MFHTFRKHLLNMGAVGGLLLLFALVAALPAQAQQIPASLSSKLSLTRTPVLVPRAPTAAAWSALGNGVSSSVYAVAISGSDLYVAGNFQDICGSSDCASNNTVANYIAKWNGTAWSALQGGVNGTVKALVLSGTDLYVGGSFTLACANVACAGGSTTVNHIAKWDGTGWSALGLGVNDDVNALAFDGTNLYVGGSFTASCGNSVCNNTTTTLNHIAEWTNSSWSALDNGVNNDVNALVFNGTDLYATGSFAQVCGPSSCGSGDTEVNYIAKWNGSWSSVGNGFGDPGTALASDGTNVYAGGYFFYLCSDQVCNTTSPAYHIAKWSGSAWSAVDNGLDNVANAIVVHGSDVYFGGEFTHVCGNSTCDNNNISMNRLVKWSGSTWSAVGNGLDYFVDALAVTDGGLFAGGDFSAVCGNSACTGNTTVHSIAQYGCALMPRKPVPTTPANNASLTKSRPTLKWTSAGCVDSYQVTLKKVGGGFHITTGALTVTHYKTDLLPNGTFKWFVTACAPLGCVKSQTNKFTKH